MHKRRGRSTVAEAKEFRMASLIFAQRTRRNQVKWRVIAEGHGITISKAMRMVEYFTEQRAMANRDLFKKAKAALEENGFELIRSHGGHFLYRKDQTLVNISHDWRDKNMVNRVLKNQAGIHVRL